MPSKYAAVSQYSDLVTLLQNPNHNLSCPSPRFLFSLLGKPRNDSLYGEDDGPLDNPKLQKLMSYRVDVGPFKVKGLRPAVESLKNVMADIYKEQKDIYNRLSNVGMLVVRFQRSTKKYPVGSPNRPISSHSWGTAIDLKIDGLLDIRGDNKSQYALNLITPIFNRHSWYWGGAFPVEDSMHFEVSKEKLLEWQKAGLFGPVSKQRTEVISSEISKSSHVSSTSMDHSRFELRKGDKGPKVEMLQNSLRSHNYNIISDGRFGSKTEAALMDFQRKHGLAPNGVAGLKTSLYLALFR